MIHQKFIANRYQYLTINQPQYLLIGIDIKKPNILLLIHNKIPKFMCKPLHQILLTQ
ncbi:MAG: hypothetical protein Hyperionvirus50_4 [Hyperionvirus sp.]|uniref:Uncharacterized protein n=1 Tax=Hyperionvirus sp. TaxID=2487770 RepID=A0A3G5ACL5_9VIRU|nr:MAG: hypothetical protein Hyperionvirus50_4 [Hyperionvirus sp.]